MKNGWYANFISLNKVCPRTTFPDQMVDATASHEMLLFMDTYSGYNYTKIHVLDEEHTSSITDQRIIRVMSFGLKSVGALIKEW